MTTYRLPDWLGGHGCSIIADHGNGRVDVRLLDWGIVVELERTSLTEVKPPLPPEPPSGGAAASNETVWLHSHRGWFDGFAAEPQFLSWYALNARHPELRVLVADPARAYPDRYRLLGDTITVTEARA